MDRFTKGAIAGLVAGIIKDIPAFAAQIINHKFSPTYWDYAGILGFGKIPSTFWEYAYATLVQLVISVAVGVVLTLFISKYPSNYLWKAGYGGILFWTTVRAAVVAFKIQPLDDPQLAASVLNMVTTFGYGLIIGWFYKILK
jgi:hypothetical protein